MRILCCIIMLVSGGCATLPDGVQPVQGFDLSRYLGHWYEIARLDHSFERGLTHVTAEYSLRDDGRVRVVNRGYNPQEGRWETARGVAEFVGPPDVGRLKVSFFGPFYGAYTIIALDKAHYDTALVCGPDRSYLWILARQPRLDPSVYQTLVARARALGFPVQELIRVDQEPVDLPPDSKA